MEIILHSKGENYIVLIDEEDYDRVSKHTWHIHHQPSSKYCRTNIIINEKPKKILLHRFLMDMKNGDNRVINHIDGNGLNNKKSNLEICDQNYNQQSINKKTRFGCIYFIKNGRNKKYVARVNINKKLYQKYFYTYAEAESWLEGLKQVAIAETLPFTN